jgi:hypothetical protein
MYYLQDKAGTAPNCACESGYYQTDESCTKYNNPLVQEHSTKGILPALRV